MYVNGDVAVGQVAVKQNTIYSQYTEFMKNLGTIFNQSYHTQEEIGQRINELKSKPDATSSEINQTRNLFIRENLKFINDVKNANTIFSITNGDASDLSASYKEIASEHINNADVNGNEKLGNAEYIYGDLLNAPEDMRGDYISNDDEFTSKINQNDSYGAATLLGNECLLTDEYYSDIIQEFNSINTNHDDSIDVDELSSYYEDLDLQDGAQDGNIDLSSAIDIDSLLNEKGEYTVKTDKWDSKNPNNLDCPYKFVENLTGYKFNSKEGQAWWNHIKQLNPWLNNGFPAGKEVVLYRKGKK